MAVQDKNKKKRWPSLAGAGGAGETRARRTRPVFAEEHRQVACQGEWDGRVFTGRASRSPVRLRSSTRRMPTLTHQQLYSSHRTAAADVEPKVASYIIKPDTGPQL